MPMVIAYKYPPSSALSTINVLSAKHECRARFNTILATKFRDPAAQPVNGQATAYSMGAWIIVKVPNWAVA